MNVLAANAENSGLGDAYVRQYLAATATGVCAARRNIGDVGIRDPGSRLANVDY